MESQLSRKEMEEMCEVFIKEFLGKKQSGILRIDIEKFITEYCKLKTESAVFAEFESGRCGFISDGICPLPVFENQRIVDRVFPKRTIVFDERLLKDQNRLRFTLAHEVSHFLISINEPELLTAHYRTNLEKGVEKHSFKELSDALTLIEWQADAMAGTLLMPKFVIENALRKYKNLNPVIVYGDTLLKPGQKADVRCLAYDLGVSFTALMIRLRQLKLIEYRSASEYARNEYCIGGI